MRQMKKTGIFKSSTGNCTFNPMTKEAISYNWFVFTKVIDGKLIFNNYRYSNTTARHQYKVKSLLERLNIKVDMVLPIPNGLQDYNDLEAAIVDAETHLCDEYLRGVLKRQDQYQKIKTKRLAKRLEDYLENSVCFRDYEIKPASEFGKYNKVAVHQIVEPKSLEQDVENALHSFHRDGFGNIVFYVGSE